METWRPCSTLAQTIWLTSWELPSLPLAGSLPLLWNFYDSPPPPSLPAILPNRAFADKPMQFPVCWIISRPKLGERPSRVSHCSWKTDVPEPPTASHSMQSEHLAALNDLNFQLFGGSELCHQPQTGSGEPVGCQLNPKLRLREYNHNL